MPSYDLSSHGHVQGQFSRLALRIGCCYEITYPISRKGDTDPSCEMRSQSIFCYTELCSLQPFSNYCQEQGGRMEGCSSVLEVFQWF